MKLKHLFFAMIAVVLFSFIGITSVNAQTGPSNEYAFIYIENMQEYHSIYFEGTVNNDELEGVSYDLSTNTLTLSNYNTDLALITNKMGDDFKIKLVGKNSVSMICSYGDNYGGSVTITGDGVLDIDTTKFGLKPSEGEDVNAISLYAENDNSILTVEKTATVNINAQSNAISIIGTPNSNKKNVVVLKNGQDISSNIVKEDNCYIDYERVNSLMFTQDGDWKIKYTVYTKDGKMYGMTRTSSQYIITSEQLTYIPELEKYILDPTSSDSGVNQIFNSEEEIAKAGYVATDKEVSITSYASESEYGLSQDDKGNKYVTWNYYSNGNVTEYVYDVSDYTVTLSDGKAYHVLTENKEVDASTLKEVTKEVKTGLYNYAVNVKSLTIAPTGNEVKPEEKEDEEVIAVKIEAAENNTEDKAAKKEVTKLITSIVSKEDGTVEGVDEDLAKKIREKVNNGDTIKVDVVTEEVKAEDVKADAEKVEEKISGTNKKVAAYFDIDVLVKTANENLGNVTNLKDKITLSVDIPSDLPTLKTGYTRVYKVIRVHNGVAEELDTSVSGDKVTFTSDKFSTYALTYEDVKNKTTNNPATGDNEFVYIAMFMISVISIVSIKVIKK